MRKQVFEYCIILRFPDKEAEDELVWPVTAVLAESEEQVRFIAGAALAAEDETPPLDQCEVVVTPFSRPRIG